MTSELKPCPLAKSLLVAADEVAACGGGNEAEIMRVAAKKLTELNTRAMPDVPELVRYKPEYEYDFRSIITTSMQPNIEGDYVLYDQVAGIITAERQSAVAAEADNKLLRDALEPFVDHAKDRDVDDAEWRNTDTIRIVATVGQLRKARAAIEGVDRG